MRCRKARSLLSAACFDELGNRQQAAIREHLAACPACRKEASYYSSIKQGVGEMPSETLSDSFNNRLLNRIAQERFVETRSKAYLPRRAPRFNRRLLVPALATAALVAVVAVNSYQPDRPQSFSLAVAEAPGHIDDSYLTVQPTDNPNVTVGLKNSWRLDEQLAKTERLQQISRNLTNRYGFGNMHLTGGRLAGTGGFLLLPRPVSRIYQVNGGLTGGEDDQAY